MDQYVKVAIFTVYICSQQLDAKYLLVEETGTREGFMVKVVISVTQI